MKITSQNKEAVKQNNATKSQTSGESIQEKLGITSRQMRDSKLYSLINEWYGVPYKYGSCQKNGIDCSCFAGMLCEKAYNQQLARNAGDIFKQCKQISLSDAKEGDLCFFKIGGNQITHVGVYLKKKLFVHASTSKGVVINSLDEAYYKKYFFSAGRIVRTPIKN